MIALTGGVAKEIMVTKELYLMRGASHTAENFTATLARIGSMLNFFSSRRRHTRSDRDWSSEVCSSDLAAAAGIRADQIDGWSMRLAGPRPREQIGRASCRGRGEISGGAVSFKKKNSQAYIRRRGRQIRHQIPLERCPRTWN